MLSKSFDDFFKNFSFYPNIIEANIHTYSQFDFLINEIPGEKENVGKINLLNNILENPSENEYTRITSFATINASVEFAIDQKLKDKEFQLIFDSDPDWEGENLIINSPVEKFENIKI